MLLKCTVYDIRSLHNAAKVSQLEGNSKRIVGVIILALLTVNDLNSLIFLLLFLFCSVFLFFPFCLLNIQVKRCNRRVVVVVAVLPDQLRLKRRLLQLQPAVTTTTTNKMSTLKTSSVCPMQELAGKVNSKAVCLKWKLVSLCGIYLNFKSQ